MNNLLLMILRSGARQFGESLTIQTIRQPMMKNETLLKGLDSWCMSIHQPTNHEYKLRQDLQVCVQVWVGSFFPPHTSSGDFLRLYSRKLTTVEGNTSFYAI